MNKKTITTISVATILALITAFLILHFLYKPQLLKNDKETPQLQEVQNIQKETIQELAKEVPTKKLTADKNKTNKPTKINVNKTEQKTQINVQTSTVEEKESIENNIQEAQVETTPEQNSELGVEVPVNYVSKNTYKYVYTPAKFPKKKH